MGQISQVFSGQKDEGQSDVDQEPGHLLAGDGVGGEGESGPQRENDPEVIALAQVVESSQGSEHQGQSLVHGQADEVVVPGLVASGDILLGNPVPHALPDSGECAGWVGKHGGVEGEPHQVEDSGADEPGPSAPCCPEGHGNCQGSGYQGDGDDVVPGKAVGGSVDGNSRREHGCDHSPDTDQGGGQDHVQGPGDSHEKHADDQWPEGRAGEEEAFRRDRQQDGGEGQVSRPGWPARTGGVGNGAEEDEDDGNGDGQWGHDQPQEAVYVIPPAPVEGNQPGGKHQEQGSGDPHRGVYHGELQDRAAPNGRSGHAGVFDVPVDEFESDQVLEQTGQSRPLGEGQRHQQKEESSRAGEVAQAFSAEDQGGELGDGQEEGDNSQGGGDDEGRFLGGEHEGQDRGGQVEVAVFLLLEVAPHEDEEKGGPDGHDDVVAAETAEVQQDRGNSEHSSGDERTGVAQTAAEQVGEGN